MLMMVMNTWTTRVNGTSCTYDDDDEGDIYCGVFEKMMIQMMRVMEMNTTHGRMGPVAHQLNRIAAHNVMHQIQMVLDRIICITSKQALWTPPPIPNPQKRFFFAKTLMSKRILEPFPYSAKILDDNTTLPPN